MKMDKDVADRFALYHARYAIHEPGGADFVMTDCDESLKYLREKKAYYLAIYKFLANPTEECPI